jgi:outer membrane protein TolC
VIPVAYPQSARVLRLADCLAIAQEHSLIIRSAENSIQGARLAQTEVRASGLPRVTLSALASHAPTSTSFGYDPAISNGGQLSGQVLLQENLYDGGGRGLRLDQARLDIERTQLQRRKSEQDVRLDVTSSYADVAAAQQEVVLQQARVEDLTQYLKLVNQLFRGGRVGYSDVLKTDVDLRNIQVLLDKAELGRETATIALAQAMGTPNDTAFSVMAELELQQGFIDSLVHRTAYGSTDNLDLSLARLDVRRSELDIDLSKSERLPMVSLIADAGIVTSGENLQVPPSQRNAVFGYSVGISIENLLFDFGLTSSRIEQRQVEAENRKLQFELQRRGLTADLSSRQAQIQHITRQLAMLRQNVKTAEDNYLLTKSLYAGGGTLALEVLSAEQLLSDSRVNELQALLDLRKIAAQLERLRAQ